MNFYGIKPYLCNLTNEKLCFILFSERVFLPFIFGKLWPFLKHLSQIYELKCNFPIIVTATKSLYTLNQYIYKVY